MEVLQPCKGQPGALGVPLVPGPGVAAVPHQGQVLKGQGGIVLPSPNVIKLFTAII